MAKIVFIILNRCLLNEIIIYISRGLDNFPLKVIHNINDVGKKSA